MSYTFAPDRGYRMPTHFGPLPGPRQRPEGGHYADDADQRAVLIWASFDVDRDRIAALLPPGFEPAADPDVTIEIKNMTGIGWLGGRGYSVVFVTTAVHRTGPADDHPADGRFKLILWENAADPIITGREELGYPKVFADITEVALSADGSNAAASASWDGYTFLELEVTGLDDGAQPAPGGPSYHLKYIPRTSVEPAGHDLAVTILTTPGQGPLHVLERRGGTGSVRFHPGTFQQLPTLGPIVEAFAGLKLGACRAAGFTRTAGTTDLRDQLVVAEA